MTVKKVNLTNYHYSKVTDSIKSQVRVFPERIPTILKHEKIALKKSKYIKEQLFHMNNIKYLETLV